MSKKVIKEILSWILLFVIAFALAKAVNRFVIFIVSSPTGSMENTFMIDDKVVVSRLSYVFGKPKRGDIVVFPFPDDPDTLYIKRIIGLPGETIEGKEGLVYIDGELFEEDYLKEKAEGDFGPYQIPQGHYFMMGDNRNISADARYWENKYVALEDIQGKALLKFPDFKWLN